MAQQIEGAADNAEVEPLLLRVASDTAAYSGLLRVARGLAQSGIDKFRRAQMNEQAAWFGTLSALREGLFGNFCEANNRPNGSKLSPAGMCAWSGDALALAGIPVWKVVVALDRRTGGYHRAV
jgi:hypothetical protein